ncbi:MAG: hypothetical protein ORN98_03055, partial [Alphaproteobacteria bacterium]|nr:hypothetical protein [Alphaproteobacteria bacterium]
INQMGSITASGTISVTSNGAVVTTGGNAFGMILTGLTSYQGITVKQTANILNTGNTGVGNAIGLSLNGKIWSAGSITATQSGNIRVKTGVIGVGIVFTNVAATAHNDATFTQSGVIKNGSFTEANNVLTFNADAVQNPLTNIGINVLKPSTITGGGAGFSWVTLRTDNLNLKLDGGLTISNSEVRIDLYKTGQLDVGGNKITATNLNLYYSGGTSPILTYMDANKKVLTNSTAIDLGVTTNKSSVVTGGGNFTLVENLDEGVGTPTLGATTAMPSWVKAGGNQVNNSGNQYIGASSRGDVTLSGDGNKNLTFVEGKSVTIAAAGATYAKNLVINTIGGAGTAGAVIASGNLTAKDSVSVFTHGGDFVLGNNITVALTNTTTPLPTIMLNLGGVDNGGSFTNAGFTLSATKDLTVLAGNWNIT